VLPNRLAYPELIPEEFHPRCLYEDREGLGSTLRALLRERPEPPATLREKAASFDWSVLADHYDRVFEKVIGISLP
jgi:hypothetical protein